MLEVKIEVFRNPLGKQIDIPSGSSFAMVLWQNCLSVLFSWSILVDGSQPSLHLNPTGCTPWDISIFCNILIIIMSEIAVTALLDICFMTIVSKNGCFGLRGCLNLITHLQEHRIRAFDKKNIDKNPACGRHWISRPMRIIGPIYIYISIYIYFFWTNGELFLLTPSPSSGGGGGGYFFEASKGGGAKKKILHFTKKKKI